MDNGNISLISYNVKGIQNYHKRNKIFDYLRKNVNPNGLIFLQETHSSSKEEKKWENDFKGQLFLSQGKTNYYGVALGYYGTKKFSVLNISNNVNGRILLLEFDVDGDIYVLVNFYNSNIESDQLHPLSELDNFLDNVADISKIVGGDFNLFFDSLIGVEGGNPVLKKRSLAKIIEILENYDLCHIWTITYTKTKRFTFRQKHFSGLIQRSWDYFFVSNILQEFLKHTDIFASLSSVHSPILVSLMKSFIPERGRRLWKFNCSLPHNVTFIEEMKNHLTASLKNFDEENIRNRQIWWELLKYEM